MQSSVTDHNAALSPRHTQADKELEQVGQQNWADMEDYDTTDFSLEWQTVKNKKSPSKQIKLARKKPITRPQSRIPQ